MDLLGLEIGQMSIPIFYRYTTVELPLNGTCFDWSSAIYGHFLFSGVIFHGYFTANQSYVVPSHF